MTEPHRHADRLETDIKLLKQALPGDSQLALAIAKRVRRTSTLLVQALAVERDKRHD